MANKYRRFLKKESLDSLDFISLVATRKEGLKYVISSAGTCSGRACRHLYRDVDWQAAAAAAALFDCRQRQ